MPDTYILFVHHIRFIRISKIWTQIFKRNFTVGVGIIERKHKLYHSILLFLVLRRRTRNKLAIINNLYESNTYP